MRGNPPVFADPTLIEGLPSSTTWHPDGELLLNTAIDDNTRFTERFAQPAPSVSQLDRASARIDQAVRSDLNVPHDVAPYVRSLVGRTVGGASTQYRKARKLLEYFTDPAHGFTYDLQTKVGDSGSDLVDFLQNRRGFCQQYAAALGIMLRIAGVPSRVVLGYMHAAPGRDQSFTVGTSDAHSWVEAWFAGVGWVPFDPTPAAGLAAGAADGMPWAPHPQGTSSAAGVDPRVSKPHQGTPSLTASAAATAPRAARRAAGTAPASRCRARSAGSRRWAAAARPGVGGDTGRRPRAASPAAVRRRAARRNRPAVGRAVGHGGRPRLRLVRRRGHPARWPAGWAAHAPQHAGELSALAAAVERERYAPAGSRPEGVDGRALVAGLQALTGELRQERSGRARWRARFWPASVSGSLSPALRERLGRVRRLVPRARWRREH